MGSQAALGLAAGVVVARLVELTPWAEAELIRAHEKVPMSGLRRGVEGTRAPIL